MDKNGDNLHIINFNTVYLRQYHHPDTETFTATECIRDWMIAQISIFKFVFLLRQLTLFLFTPLFTHPATGQEEITTEEKSNLLKEVENNRKHYSILFDPEEHQEAVERGDRRLSYTALQASLLIMLYQNEPILQQPAHLIKLCIDVDELMTLWRHRHAIMVHRMIGRKLGKNLHTSAAL